MAMKASWAETTSAPAENMDSKSACRGAVTRASPSPEEAYITGSAIGAGSDTVRSFPMR